MVEGKKCEHMFTIFLGIESLVFSLGAISYRFSIVNARGTSKFPTQ